MQLILTHSQADFDALAAQLAAARLYPLALPVLSNQLNANVREFLALYAGELPFVATSDMPAEPVTQLILVDTQIRPRLPILGDAPIPTVIIDHHPQLRPPYPHETLIGAETGATTTILVQQLMQGNVPLTSLEATLLLLGIYEDTGTLTLPTTRAIDVQCVAWLLQCRARIEAVGEFLLRPLTAEQDLLFRQIEAGVQQEEIAGWSVLLAQGRVDGPVPELSTLAHRLRDLYAPAVLVLAVSTGDAGTQLIFRSQGESLDAGALAARFGGGGHRAAAAAYVRGRAAADVLTDVISAVRTMIRPALTAADVMTRHVHTVDLAATIAEAEAVLLRYGHGALPVIDAQGIVQGLITRRDLDRAGRHGLRDRPLARYMWHGPAMITPDTPLVAVRQQMLAGSADRSGRILVVDAHRRLLGLITRSDLAHAWVGGREADRDDRESMEQALEAFLKVPNRIVLAQAASIAEAQGAALYIVGGTVRDMLLGRPQEDLDLVVEGDAINVARALADAAGGQVRSHTQFGTATIELPAGWRVEGAPADARFPAMELDLVTARNEFYERPSALPQVEAASLRHDLHRRDFTINTLAVCLNPSRYGRFYDFYGGRRDLERGLIRVLHNLSFIDDPTRVLRAARLAARLSFVIEPRTRALIADSIEQDVFGRTTPQRIINELRLICGEAYPERVLEQLDELGVLRRLHPSLGWAAVQSAQVAVARAVGFDDVSPSELCLGLVVYPLSEEERAAIVGRYRLPAVYARLLREIDRVRAVIPTLQQAELRDSQLDRTLHGISVVALRTAQLIEREPTTTRIDHYLGTLRGIEIAVTGAFLRELGLHPGPSFGELLAAVRAARIDGIVQTRAEEERWLRDRVTRSTDVATAASGEQPT